MVTALLAVFFCILALPALLPLILAAWPLVLLLGLLVWLAIWCIKGFLKFFGF